MDFEGLVCQAWQVQVQVCIKGLQQGLSTKRINSIYTLDKCSQNRLFEEIIEFF